jgi:Concanavalin A-like lectin/glucanases superfamily
VFVSSGDPRFDLDFGNRRLCAQPPPDMRAWWAFDEENGPLADDLAGANDVGRHISGPAIVPGKVRNALLFNGQQFVHVPASPEVDFGAGDFSIDAWIRTADNVHLATILDKRFASIGYSLFLLNGRLGIQLSDRNRQNGAVCGSDVAKSNCTNYGSPLTAAKINDGLWHHIAVTVDRDQAAGGVFYVDGAAVGTFNPTLRPQSLTSTAALRIGGFGGRIDELELFGRALTAAEVQAIFEADAAGKCKQTCGVAALIQSNLGTRGDFEVVVPDDFGGLLHYRRDNDQIGEPWSSTTFVDIFAGRAGAASLIQSNYGANGHFDAVGRYGDRLVHYWRDNDDPLRPWTRTETFAQGVRGTPSLKQGVTGPQGDFELVVPLASGGLGHYRRVNHAAGGTWVGPVVFGAAEGVFDDAALIYNGNVELEVVARIGDRLAHFIRSGGAWGPPEYFATGVSGAPAFALGRFALTSEVVAPLAAGGLGHWQRTYFDTFAWFGPVAFAANEGNFHSAALIYSNYDNLEVVGQQCGRMLHYWTPMFGAGPWSPPIRLTP